jgi:hypothetical protein
LKNENEEKKENEEMRNDDIVILQDNQDIQIQKPKDTNMTSTDDEFTCRKEEDFLRSQNFLNDFINYLSNIAKVRIRSVNSAIFPQITAEVVKLISMRYDA